MDNNSDLARQVIRLQRRVNLLTAALVAAFIIIGISGARAIQDDDINVRRIRADSIQAKRIEIRGDAGTSSIHIAAGEAGSQLFFRNAERKNQVTQACA